jgi:prepilin-type N-terminal cleavage/methylation domain-containing protein
MCLRHELGFTLIELLVTITILSLMMTAVFGAFALQNHVYIQQDATTELEENVRIGMPVVLDRLRGTGYGVPTTNLTQWVPWVTGFSSNPLITTGPPATISVAACTAVPVATLNGTATQGATTLTLSDASEVDTSTRRLLWIGEQTFALVTGKSGATVTIDTDPTTTGNQGLPRAYLVGTPICRVDVVTYSVNSSTQTLQLDEHHGAGAVPVIEHVSDFRITTVNTARYEIRVTVSGQALGTVHGTQTVTRELTSDVLMRNKL